MNVTRKIEELNFLRKHINDFESLTEMLSDNTVSNIENTIYKYNYKDAVFTQLTVYKHHFFSILEEITPDIMAFIIENITKNQLYIKLNIKFPGLSTAFSSYEEYTLFISKLVNEINNNESC